MARQRRTFSTDFKSEAAHLVANQAQECSRRTAVHKIVDWEAGALYWNCRRSHGAGWEAPFRAMMEEQLGGRELMFLMGNQHRFQDQWLIISLFYPPKRKPAAALQQSLF